MTHSQITAASLIAYPISISDSIPDKIRATASQEGFVEGAKWVMEQGGGVWVRASERMPDKTWLGPYRFAGAMKPFVYNVGMLIHIQEQSILTEVEWLEEYKP